MAVNESVARREYFSDLFAADDPATVMRHPEAGERILALARLAVRKVFWKVGLWEEERRAHWEDAVQQAAADIWQNAERGPRTAYGLAKKRLVRWIVRVVWQGKPRTEKDARLGRKTIPPRSVSIQGVQEVHEGWEPYFIHKHNRAGTPEEALLERDRQAEREACVDQMYDVIYDLVANRMGLERRRHHTAHNDAQIFDLTLRGANTKTVMNELELSENMAIQRIRYARERLAEFCEEQGGTEAVAAWYAGLAAGAQQLTDARARQAFACEYAEERAQRYEAERGEPAPRRTRERWRSQARRLWDAREVEAAALAG